MDGEGEMLLQDCTFENIGGNDGGVISIGNFVTTQIIGSHFKGNSAEMNGGVLLASGQPTIYITNCTFE